MRPGETIATFDVGLALRGKSGRFEVTSPTGEIYDVTCKSHHSISNLEWSGDGSENPPFLIRKVAENASVSETRATTKEMPEEESPVVSSRLPFVLEPAADEGHLMNAGHMELMYLDEDPETGQPSAYLYLKTGLRDHAFEVEMTARCATLNELDSEIRRIQAQLDEIRSRAKKMFYKTHAVAASA